MLLGRKAGIPRLTNLNIMAHSRHHTALVTGGASGIGLATARVLLKQGWSVIVVDRKLPRRFPIGPRNRICRADVTDTDAFCGVLDGLRDQLDALVLCAAESPFTSEPEKIIRTNACAPIANTLACRSMLRRDASVVLLGGTAAYRVSMTTGWQRLLAALITEDKNIKLPEGSHRLSGEEAYRRSKRLVLEAAQPLARLLSDDCIRVNCLMPGPTATPMSRPVWHDKPERWRMLLNEAPFNRSNGVIECAEMIAFLCGSSARNLTGSLLHLDGGWFLTHEH